METTTILIVDDEKDLREAIAFDFRRKKFRVFTASCGTEALNILGEKNVDVVLSDVRMPNGDGVELLDKLKERNVFLPTVLFITGFSDLTLEEAFHKGADAVFSKPFDRQALFEAVSQSVKPLKERFHRKETRMNTEFPVGMRFRETGITEQAIIRNIGRGGMFVQLNGLVPLASEEVEFRLESDTNPKIVVSGKGIVRWTRKEPKENLARGCGIEFYQLAPESIDQLVDFVVSNRTKPYIPMT